MGHAHLKSNNPREATTNYQKAVTLFQKTGDKAKESETLWNLAQASKQEEKIPEAIELAEAALVLYGRIKCLNQDTRKTIEDQLNLWKEEAGVEISADPEERPAS